MSYGRNSWINLSYDQVLWLTVLAIRRKRIKRGAMWSVHLIHRFCMHPSIRRWNPSKSGSPVFTIRWRRNCVINSTARSAEGIHRCSSLPKITIHTSIRSIIPSNISSNIHSCTRLIKHKITIRKSLSNGYWSPTQIMAHLADYPAGLDRIWTIQLSINSSNSNTSNSRSCAGNEARNVIYPEMITTDLFRICAGRIPATTAALWISVAQQISAVSSRLIISKGKHSVKLQCWFVCLFVSLLWL